MNPIGGEAMPLVLAAAGGGDLGPAMQRFVLQMAVILLAARLGGRLTERWLRLPAVVGELVAGILIGPYLLGGWSVPGLGPLFPLPAEGFPITPELYAIATLASLLLLFLAGLETDIDLFLRFSGAGSLVGLGGLVLSMAAGIGTALVFGLADHALDPAALFLGVVCCAASVGIPARVLAERRRTDSPEGVTILTGAVISDVFGVVLLAVVIAVARAGEGGEPVPWLRLGGMALRAVVIWVACTVIGVVSGRRIGRALKALGSLDVAASVALGLALLLAGAIESVGLAMILGAYLLGFSLSRTDMVHEIRRPLRGAAQVLVPVFFCVMGMLIDPAVLWGVVGAGLVFTAVSLAAKVVGCGLPAWFRGFNLRGALRIGMGMSPRGEVALIAAGIGLSSGVAGPEVFGMAVGMALLTVVIAPPVLARLLDGGSGLRRGVAAHEPTAEIALDLPSADLAEFLLGRVQRIFRDEEFFVHALSDTPPVFQIRKDDMVFTLELSEARIRLTCPKRFEHIARMMVLEELLSLKDLAEAAAQLRDPAALGGRLVDRLF